MKEKEKGRERERERRERCSLVDTTERETMAATGGQVSSKVAEASGGDTTHGPDERTNERTYARPRLLFLAEGRTDHGRTYARTDEQTTDALSRGAASHWRLLAAPLPTSWLILDGVCHRCRGPSHSFLSRPPALSPSCHAN